MEEEPNYKDLYEVAQLDLKNLKAQLMHWEMKASMLRRLIERQEELTTDLEEKAALIKTVAFNIKRIVS